ncbi:MAG: HAD family hydrolase [Oligoflexus sp.]
MSRDSSDKPAIIFDFGGVLLNLDFQATINAFHRLMGQSIQYNQLQQEDFFDQLERGSISATDFRQRMRQAAGGVDITDAMIDDAWNAMLGDLPRERIAFLQELAADFRLFLLSNTNEIHKAAFDKTLEASFGGNSNGFDQLFEAAYYSHLIGERKPDAAAYQYIISRHELDPKKTWFIDDNPFNIAGAAALGIQCVHLQSDLMLWYQNTGQQLFYAKS